MSAKQIHDIIRRICKHPEIKCTLRTIARLIYKKYGVTYSDSHLRRILRNAGLKPKPPQRGSKRALRFGRRARYWRCSQKAMRSVIV